MDELQHALEGIDVLSLDRRRLRRHFGRGDRFSSNGSPLSRPGLSAPEQSGSGQKARTASADRPLPAANSNSPKSFRSPRSPAKAAPDLVNAWLARLPEAPPYFPADQFTDQPERFLAAEIIREKAILATREEVPTPSPCCSIVSRRRKDLIRIRATIYVEREGQKGILIGKRGETMKKIGTQARKELESILGIAHFLELFVKVQPQLAPESHHRPPARLAPPTRTNERSPAGRQKLRRKSASQDESRDQERIQKLSKPAS